MYVTMYGWSPISSNITSEDFICHTDIHQIFSQRLQNFRLLKTKGAEDGSIALHSILNSIADTKKSITESSFNVLILILIKA